MRATLAIVALLVCVTSHGRPVSYVGGWTVIEASNRQATSVLVHYTPHPRLSVGWRSERDRAMALEFHGAQFTALAKRWFGENYQGNVYGLAGVGTALGIDENPAGSQTAGFVGLMADWETRRLPAVVHSPTSPLTCCSSAGASRDQYSRGRQSPRNRGGRGA